MPVRGFVALLLLATLSGCNKPKPTPITTFSGERGFEVGGMRYVDFTNVGPALTDVDVTITVWFDDGSSTELHRQFTHWDANERKRIHLSPGTMESIQRYKLEGGGQRNGEPITCLAEFISDPIAFGLDRRETPTGFELSVWYRGVPEIREVRGSLTLHREDGSQETLPFYWATLKADEHKTMQAASGPTIQKVTLGGNAEVNGKVVPISFYFTW